MYTYVLSPLIASNSHQQSLLLDQHLSAASSQLELEEDQTDTTPTNPQQLQTSGLEQHQLTFGSQQQPELRT